ncbi:MAG TPA: hypothetical protein VE782_02100, partial [Myxococcaceae bacterium]|nr:hypothetical protein [Myxococcaceae bacterium]
YETSIQPDQDCCQLFLPRHPSVSATHAECEAAEAKMDVQGLVQDALARTASEFYEWPVRSRPNEAAAIT